MGQSDSFTHHFRPTVSTCVRNVLRTLCVLKWRNAEANSLRAFLCFFSPIFGYYTVEGRNLKAKPQHRESQQSWGGCNI